MPFLTLFVFSNCQQDLELPQFAKSKNSNLSVSLVKTEELAQGITKATYSNGMELYMIPNDKVNANEPNSALSCSIPNGATGCCCLDFWGYQTHLPSGTPLVRPGFLFYLKFYYISIDYNYAFHLKITKLNTWIGTNEVWFDDFLIWAERPNWANCTDSFSLLVTWNNFPLCEGEIEVNARRMYKASNASSYSTCAQTDAVIYYMPPGLMPCMY